MTEQYIPWVVKGGLSTRLNVIKIEDNNEGLFIYMKEARVGSPKEFLIKFDPYICYRNTDERYRARTFALTGGFSHSLNIVNNSAWLKEFHLESEGYYAEDEIIHYSIITDADCIDVLSEFPPEFVFL